MWDGFQRLIKLLLWLPVLLVLTAFIVPNTHWVTFNVWFLGIGITLPMYLLPLLLLLLGMFIGGLWIKLRG